jgi:hypothetical protein
MHGWRERIPDHQRHLADSSKTAGAAGMPIQAMEKTVIAF